MLLSELVKAVRVLFPDREIGNTGVHLCNKIGQIQRKTKLRASQYLILYQKS